MNYKIHDRVGIVDVDGRTGLEGTIVNIDSNIIDNQKYSRYDVLIDGEVEIFGFTVGELRPLCNPDEIFKELLK